MTLVGPALRRLARRPVLGMTAIATLAIALGANVAIFSLLDTVGLQPLPFADAGRLVFIGSSVPTLPDLRGVSWPRFHYLESQTRAYESVTAFYEGSFALTEKGRAELVGGMRVSGQFFQVFRVSPILGRTFSASEEAKGGAAVAVLSYGFWRHRLGGDPHILGRSLLLDGHPTTVVGVMPDAFHFPYPDVQLWLPRPDVAEFLTQHFIDAGSGYLEAVGRLRVGETLAGTDRDDDRVVAAYNQEMPGQADAHYRLVPVPLAERLIGSSRTMLLITFAAVALVLLIACADIANLLLAEGLSRRTEIATRVALGAGWRQVITQILGESALVAVLGGGIGVLLALGGLRLLVAAHPADLPRIAEVSISGRGLAVALGLTGLAALLAGLAPALQTLQTDPRTFLVSSRAVGGERRTRWAQRSLVVLQIALALMLVSTSGLLVRSLERVNHLDLGMAPEHLLLVDLSLPRSKYPDLETQKHFFAEFLERVRSLHGVDVAALADYPPVTGAPHTGLQLEGQAPLPPEKMPLVELLMISDGYLKALQARLVMGTDLPAHADPHAPLTALVNRTLARQFFPGESPVGRRIRLRSAKNTSIEIVGVFEDIQQNELESGVEPSILLPEPQLGEAFSPPNFMTLLVRTHESTASMATALRQLVGTLDPNEPLTEVRTMSARVAGATEQRRLSTGLLGGFAFFSLVLCIVGIAGLTAHAISLRRKEIGLRIALGAGSREVLSSVVWRETTWIVAGLLLGAVGARWAGSLVASQLFQADGSDWFHILVVAVVLGVVAVLACLIPARRAVGIDPADSLRAS
jgi:putative ABC transport system permease protein